MQVSIFYKNSSHWIFHNDPLWVSHFTSEMAFESEIWENSGLIGARHISTNTCEFARWWHAHIVCIYLTGHPLQKSFSFKSHYWRSNTVILFRRRVWKVIYWRGTTAGTENRDVYTLVKNTSAELRMPKNYWIALSAVSDDISSFLVRSSLEYVRFFNFLSLSNFSWAGIFWLWNFQVQQKLALETWKKCIREYFFLHNRQLENLEYHLQSDRDHWHWTSHQNVLQSFLYTIQISLIRYKYIHTLTIYHSFSLSFFSLFFFSSHLHRLVILNQQSLAKFHAASLAMKSVRPHEFRLLVPQLIPHLYGGDMQAFQHMMNSSVMESISSLEGHSNEDGKFDHVIATLKDDGGKKIYEKIKNELILDETDEWNIILHGEFCRHFDGIQVLLSFLYKWMYEWAYFNRKMIFFSAIKRWSLGQQSHVSQGEEHSEKCSFRRFTSFPIWPSHQWSLELHFLHHKPRTSSQSFGSAIEHLSWLAHRLSETDTICRQWKVPWTRNWILAWQHQLEIQVACIVWIGIKSHYHFSSYLRYVNANNWIVPKRNKPRESHD